MRRLLTLWPLALVLVAGGCAQLLSPPRLPPVVAQIQPRLSPAEQIAAEAVELGSPLALDSAGLAALADAIGDARIVMLGEPWHGDGGAIQLRAELVKFLHQRLGFDVLVFEADFYSLHEAWRHARATGTAAPAAENVSAFWSETEAATPLWQYIDEQLQRGDTLHVAGVDIRMRGRLTREVLPGELHERLLGLPGVAPAEAGRAVRFLNGLFDPDEASPDVLTDENFALLVRLLSELEHHLTAQPLEGFWRQTVGSLLRNLRNEAPDPGMGANLNWLATQQYPDRKLIVWAHNNHIITNKWMFFEAPDSVLQSHVARMPERAVSASIYLGDIARQSFGSRLYSIATVPYEGTYSPDVPTYLAGRPANFDVVATLAPAPTGTLEETFANRGYDVAFVNLRPFCGMEDAVRSRVLDYSQMGPTTLRLWQGYDGILFLRRTHGLNEATPK